MRIGNLWLSKNGWEQPIQVHKSTAHKATLGPSEKAWLKACWTVIAAEELRRERSKKMREPNAFQEQPVVRTLPPHEEIVAHMEHLYDALIQSNAAPNCSKTDFAYGWASFIELMSQLETKYYYTFEHSSHSPIFEEPERSRQVLQQDVLTGTHRLANAV